MTKSKVNIMPDEHGNKIRVSTNNPEFGYIRLTQETQTIGANNWLKKQSRSTLVHGKVEELEQSFSGMDHLNGQLIIREQITAFDNNDPDRDLKMAGETGVICKAVDTETGEVVPIYRKTFFDPTMKMTDTLVPHINSDEIKEANGFEAKEVKEVSEPKSTRRNKKDDTPVEETVEEPQEVEVEESNDDSFEL
tara:strand:+ start:527 stop:1105 length:579 start_codon:yes stop_codon:yes gene_type:complete